MKKLIYAIFLAALFASCNSTQVISSWKAQNASVHKFNTILVLGVMGDKDRELRDKVEQSMAAKMKELGINAIAASTEFGPQALQGLSEKDVMNKLKSRGIDGVMMVSLLDQSQEKNYVPGNVNYTPYGVYYNRFWNSYRVMYSRVYTPGYYTNTTKYLLEANIYNVSDETLEYSAQTKSFDPGSASALASAFTKTVVGDMKQKGIIPG